MPEKNTSQTIGVVNNKLSAQIEKNVSRGRSKLNKGSFYFSIVGQV